MKYFHDINVSCILEHNGDDDPRDDLDSALEAFWAALEELGAEDVDIFGEVAIVSND